MSGGFWYCQKTSLPSPFCNSSLSIALLTPLPVPSWWPEHEGAICHTVLIPARVLRARHSPLTRLGCHVCWLTGKVTSGDKRPQLESVTNLPSFFFLSSPTSTRKICLLYLYRQPSESSHAIDFLHLATGWHPDREEGEQNRGGGGDGERQAECGIPRSDHYEKHVKRGRETEALTWASPHREKWWSGERWKKGNRQKWRKKM